MKTILMMGKTGSGKGTQAEMIAKKINGEVFSSGDKFRELRLEDTPLGRNVKREYDQGLLMPYWLASYIFQEALLNLEDDDIVVFEGVGRKLPEAQMFDEVTSWLGREYLAFFLKVSDEEVIKRQQERARDDLDQLDKIKRRLEEYSTFTVKSIEFFRDKGRLIEIDGEQDPAKVHQDILSHL